MSSYNLVTILGPTASGKTFFGAHIAYIIDGEIISADSRQIYRGMDLGTGKDYDDYIVNGSKIPFHLVDIHDAGYKYNLFEFQNDFIRVFKEIQKRKHVPIMVGGTGMYLEAVLKHYEMVRTPVNQDLRDRLKEKTQDELVTILRNYGANIHNTTDLKVRKRTIRAIEIADYYKNQSGQLQDFPDIRSLIFGVKYDRNSRRKRITERLKRRLEEGMIDEVKSLLEKTAPEDLIYYGLEYKFITLFLIGKLSYDEMFQKLEIAIHQFAKRQMTWFRKMERYGYIIHWLDGHLSIDEKIDRSIKIINQEAPEIITNV
jgi:tRNA dimethylallyltransferase